MLRFTHKHRGDNPDSICGSRRTGLFEHEFFFLLGRLARPPGHVERSTKDLRQLHREQFHPKGDRVLRQLFQLWNCAGEQQRCSKIPRLANSSPLFANIHATAYLSISEGFDSLADLIASYTLITRRTHFVFVPGPLDLVVNSILPRKPLLSSFTGRLQSKIPKLHLTSNPCRLKFFGQEIVVFRDDIMSRMLRNLVGVKPDARNEDLKRYVWVSLPSSARCLNRLSPGKLVQSILDQSHLAPFTTHIQPILPEYDHTMRLYPLPTCVRVVAPCRLLFFLTGT